jgi:hypothetical protein
MKKLLLIPFLFAALGCQSYQDGLAAICNSPQTCGEPCATAPPEMKLMMNAKHIDDVVSNGEAEAFFESLAAAAPEQKVIMLKQEAEKAGLPGCPLADMIASSMLQ